jgi:hypothetical protein
MSRLSAFLLLLPLAASAAAADQLDPAPAVMTQLATGKTFDGCVATESLSGGINFILGDPKDPGAARLPFKHGEYRLQYKDSQNLDLLRGQMAERTGKTDMAMTSLQAAASTARYEWEREEAAIDLAKVAMAAKKYDQGIQALKAFQAQFPDSVRIAEATYLLGQEMVLSGDMTGGIATFNVLKGHAKDWGISAAAMASLGSADAEAASGKLPAAIAELRPWMDAASGLDPAKNPDEFAAIGLELGKFLTQAKDPSAIATFTAVAYAPVGGADQASAQLAWATLLSDKGDAGSLLDAFDHAAIGAVLPGVGADTHAQAVALASQLVPRIGATGADEGAKQKLTVEYRGYLSKL